MAYQWTAICDACGKRQTFPIETFREKFPRRPLPLDGPTFTREDNLES